MPVDACNTTTESTSGLECEAAENCSVVTGAVDSNNQPILYNDSSVKDCHVLETPATASAQPDQVATIIAGMLCVAGPGKLPLWARIPTPGKVIIEGALRLSRRPDPG